MDGLSGFKEAMLAVFPQTQIQRCIIHQIRNRLKYVTWNDRKKFMSALKEVYQAATCESAEANLRQLSKQGADKYAVAIRSWADQVTTSWKVAPETTRSKVATATTRSQATTVTT